jgi:hypothetical protein
MYGPWEWCVLFGFLIATFANMRDILKLNPDGAVTLRKPPNNKLFDITSQSRMSPVLQRRKEQQNAAAAAGGPPVFNISLGNDFANLLQRPAAPMAPPAPLPVQVLPNPTLIPLPRLPGLDMPLSDFCQLYGLGERILQKFIDNGYTHSRMLHFIQLDDLKEMKFMLGEIAGLKDAVERWSIAS